MSDQSLPPVNERLSLKQTTGWFPAGDPFRKALAILSDGAFKLFAYLCLDADRRTGRFQATHNELALALGKSKRAIGSYVAELETRQVCSVNAGKNQFAATIFEVSDSYWPYHRLNSCPDSPEQKAYTKSVSEFFLALGCGSGKFGATEIETARQLHRRAIPIGLVQDAMLLGACRKFDSWLNGGSSEPIQSMSYFEQLIAEIQAKPLPAGYSTHLRSQLQRLAERWSKGSETEGSV